MQAVEQHESLLQGLETTSALIPRLRLMEELYLCPSTELNPDLMTKFIENLVLLYAKIIEFQARALCYLRKHPVSRLFRDMFKQDGWDDLANDMQKREASAKSSASLMETAGLRKKLADIQETLSKHHVWRTTSVRDEKVKQLFKLLYTCPYKDRKDRNSERVPGTCEWFTSHPRFENWERSNHSSLLWVSADPGCGKSVLTKFLIDDFLPSSDRRTVCYFFFKDDYSDQKSAVNALSAILRQLFMAQPHLIPDSVLVKLETDGVKLVESFVDLWDILISVATNTKAGEIICVLDALDECAERDRKQLTQTLTTFYSGNLKKQLKFLVTSRPYDHIRRDFKELEDQLPTIHLGGEGEAEIQQISREIDLVIKKRVEDISKKNDLQPDECSYLQEQLTSVPNRTYLWVSLTLDVVENMTGFTRGNIRQTIQSLPPTVDDAYDKILDRSPNQLKARRLLQIVTAAVRPLSLHELSLALAFSSGHQSISDIREELETSDERFKRTVRELCGLLLVVIDGKVHFLHQTVKEFLVPNTRSPSTLPHDYSQKNSWKHSLRLKDSREILATACMSYLSHDIQTDPFRFFLEYAAENWPIHFRTAFTQDAQEAAKLGHRLCHPRSRIFDLWTRLYYTEVSKLSTTILVASYLGLTAVVRLCTDVETADIDSEDNYGQTPLSLAAMIGYDAIVSLLLVTGKVDLDSKDNDGQTPLSLAAMNGHDAIVSLLIDTEKVDINSRSAGGYTPLSWAAFCGHEAAVSLLLNTGKVDIDSEGNDGITPLSLAAMNGHDTMLSLLLRTGKVDINSRNNDGITPLSLAAEHGQGEIVSLLLDTGMVDINSKDNDGVTPFIRAVSWGHETVVRLLLETGKVDVNSQTRWGQTPLLEAISWSHESVVKLLLDTGKVDINSKNSDGRTPLSVAAFYGEETIVKLLLDTGKVDISSKDSKGQTAISLAMEEGHEAIVSLLEQYNITSTATQIPAS